MGAADVVRNAVGVTVQHAVVHILDHRAQSLTLSNDKLAFDGNQPLRDYFSEQVSKALGDAQMGAARFSTDGEQGAIKECRRILDDSGQIVESSRRLAALLYAVMKKDGRISPGTLAVCLFTASNYAKRNFLALVKLDPISAFVQAVRASNDKK
jgi:hypothetical protein